MRRRLPMLGDLVDGKYQVQRLLSRGGNGTVYVARHVHLGTEVALKVLDATADDADERRRLLREARVAARLSHANLVPILDCGIIGDRAYVVMEFVTGGDLRSYLTRHAPLGLAATCGVIRDIAAGLTAAHDAGVVHRDLKPENVVLDARTSPPRARVVDFGLATLAPTGTLEVSQSTTPAMAGTPAYLAPEQASGAGPVTDAVDRWALGVIAYECLTGRPPFAAESLGELVLQICAWPLPTPSTAAAVPVGFDAWFARACAREPAARFPSVAAMAAALAALDRAHTAPAALAPTLTPAAPTPRPTFPGRRRRWPWLAAAGIAGVAAVAGLGLDRTPSAGPAPSTAVPIDAATATGPAAPALLRLAVLPLRVIAPTPDDLTTLAPVITAELTRGIATRTHHRVIASAAVARSVTGDQDLRVAIRQLAADRAIVGTLTARPAGVTLQVEVVDPTEALVWSHQWTRPATELDRLWADAASDLAASLGGSIPIAAQPRDPAAYRAFLEGEHHFARRDHASLLRAIGFYEDATRRDPDFVAAWVSMAQAYLTLPWSGPSPRDESHAKARAALDRALRIAPDSAEVHTARGSFLLEAEWRWTDAVDAFRRAIALAPRHAPAHLGLAEVLAYLGRFDEAAAEVQLTLELEPLHAVAFRSQGAILHYARRYTESETAWRKAIELDPAQPWARFGLGYALGMQGRFDEAQREIAADRMYELPGTAPYLTVQWAWLAKQRGDHRELARLAAKLDAGDLAGVSPWTQAFALAVLDRPDAMFAALERARVDHDQWMRFTGINAAFDPYRGDPRFAALMTRLGL